MPTNDFLGFASAGSANIMSQADYAAAVEQTDGVQPGPASSALANKVWRQGANMASAIGGALVDYGYDALDNGDINGLKTTLKRAFIMTNGSTLKWGTEDILTSSGLTGELLTTTTITNNTVTNIAEVSLNKGLYLLIFTLQFATNTSGYRQLHVSLTPTGNEVDRFRKIVFAPCAGAAVNVPLICFMSVSSTTKYYLNAYQNSGSTLNIYAPGYRVLSLRSY